MKTRAFVQLRRVREHAVQTLQKELQAVRTRRFAAAKEVESLTQALDSHKPPQEGTISQLATHNLTARIYRREIGEAVGKLQEYNHLAALVRKDLNIARIESEKIAHMQKDEQLKLLKQLKRLEEKRLDEAGLIGYAWQNRGG